MSRYTKVRTDLGTLAIAFGERGVSRILLPVAAWHDVKPADLAQAGSQTERRPPHEIAKLASALRAHIAGDVRAFSHVVLDTRDVPPFFLRVLRATQKIPAGQTRTYAELAALAGSTSPPAPSGTQ